MPASTSTTPPAEIVASDAATPAARSPRGEVTGILLRFVSCGLLSLSAGLAWRLTLAPTQVGIGSALLGILVLLSGFLIGGVLWYLRDARVRLKDPSRVSDERIIFSFIVFAIVPFAVLVFVGLIWLLSLAIG